MACARGPCHRRSVSTQCRTSVHDPAPIGHLEWSYSHEAAEAERACAAEEANLGRFGLTRCDWSFLRIHRTSLLPCWLSALL